MSTPIPRNQVSFDLSEIASLTGGRVVGDPAARIVGITTDSRAVRDTELFVALVGARLDAHRFVANVGAAACLVSDASALPAGANAVVVADTLQALGALATEHARRWRDADARRRIVAITGSAGKTSTKELTAAALRGAGFDPIATVGNLNNLVGVPMTLFTLAEGGPFAVIEMGTNAPGEIATLGAMAHADVGVVTLVAAAHTEGIGTEEDVFAEKTSLLGTLRLEGKSIVNGDDVRLARVEGALRYGRGEHCDVRVLDWSVEGDRTHVRWSVRGHFVSARLRLVGEAAAVNGAAALAVAMCLGVDVDAAAEGLAELAPVEGRMRPRTAANGALVLDDTYNANPSSTLLALRTAAAVASERGGRLVAVLGDMKELGALSPSKHREVRSAAEAVATCVFVGPEMAAVGDAVDDAQAAIAAMPTLAAADVVLVKGSRSMGLEKVVEALVEVEVAP